MGPAMDPEGPTSKLLSRGNRKPKVTEAIAKASVILPLVQIGLLASDPPLPWASAKGWIAKGHVDRNMSQKSFVCE